MVGVARGSYGAPSPWPSAGVWCEWGWQLSALYWWPPREGRAGLVTTPGRVCSSLRELGGEVRVAWGLHGAPLQCPVAGGWWVWQLSAPHWLPPRGRCDASVWWSVLWEAAGPVHVEGSCEGEEGTGASRTRPAFGVTSSVVVGHWPGWFVTATGWVPPRITCAFLCVSQTRWRAGRGGTYDTRQQCAKELGEWGGSARAAGAEPPRLEVAAAGAAHS